MEAISTRQVVDGAILIEFPGSSEPRANEASIALGRGLSEQRLNGVLDAVPGARNLLILFDPLVVSAERLEEQLRALEIDVRSLSARKVRIPVRYGDRLGPDLDQLSSERGLSPAEFTRLHREPEYRVAFIGFTPGFPYLVGLPPKLHAPRLAWPRARVPQGSVGIGGEYTGIYPSSSPGGWRLIGQAPVRLFDPNADPPSLLASGDLVSFEEVGQQEFETLSRNVREHRGDPSPPKKSPSIMRVLSGGLCPSVQGAPRFGLAHLGVPAGGPMDLDAVRRGNAFLGNPPLAAALEMTLLGPELEVERACRLCLTGGEMDAALDGRTVSLERPFGARRGQRLALRNVRRGARVYLCIENGFADLTLPGQPLRCLKSGDELQVQSGAIGPTPAAKSLGNEGALRTAPLHPMAPAESGCVLRVVLGPQDDHFSATGKQVFLSSEYRVSAQSDRRGIRLEGPAIALERPADIPPEGTAPGAIQVLGTGLPIILGPDRPVTGGYAKIATVIGADLSQLAQARPGSRVRFQAVTMAEAIAARGG